MQPRRVARELALLSISQLPNSPEKLRDKDLKDLLAAAVRTLTAEVRETLETAAAELQRGNDRVLKTELLRHEVQASDAQRAIAMVKEAIGLTQGAINRLGMALDLPEMLQMAGQLNVQDHAMELISAVLEHREALDQCLNDSMVDWQLSRLARVDRDVLRLAMAEILHLGTPDRVAVNEAVELAKRYGDPESYRFINGVLRRALDRLKADHQLPPSAEGHRQEGRPPRRDRD
ncbi:MAG: transcription antitermination factor NusB [Cyanobacteria bacterium]|nr:transcription antitermination factor NusB [Cyanobacteriota bacterium]